MEVTITKRLHVSGLTPAITKDDLANRLSIFGSVKTLDGFGLVDGVGRPRKFAYVTLEATPAKLAKCLNILSGSTWKGTKLRIGEAKPDFSQRMAVENQKASVESVKSKRRLKSRRYTGAHAKDMSLVTPESASHKGGWKVTPMGRIYRPIRMRPDHPLPPPHSSSRILQEKLKEKIKERKRTKRIKPPDIRARRKKIDMTKWGSVYLKGKFLDTDVPMLDIEHDDLEETPQEVPVDETESEDEETDKSVDVAQNSVSESATSFNVPARTQMTADKITKPTTVATPSISLDAQSELLQENQQSLNLLTSLFGDNEADWIGKESIGSDVEEESYLNRPTTANSLSEQDFEEISADRPSGIDEYVVDVQAEGDQLQSTSELPQTAATNESSASQRPQAGQPQTSKLKDLFAPREREGSFSLLGHLDLDLELDEDVPFPITEAERQPLEESATFETSTSVVIPSTSAATVSTQTSQQSVIKLDPNQHLFFPLSMLGIDRSTLKNTKGKQQLRDLFDVAKERKVHWRDPEVGFWRTETEEDIRKKWEERKVELTREWKKRWREAGKIGRRRGRGGGEGDGDV